MNGVNMQQNWTSKLSRHVLFIPRLEGYNEWKQKSESRKYDYKMIEHRLRLLKGAAEKNPEEIMLLLRSGIFLISYNRND